MTLGETYPYPIVEHGAARERAIAADALAKNAAAQAASRPSRIDTTRSQ